MLGKCKMLHKRRLLLVWILLIQQIKNDDLPVPIARDWNKVGGYPSYSGSYPSYGSSGDGHSQPDYNNYYSNTPDPKKRPYSSYPGYLYQTTSPECQEQMMDGVIGDILQTGGVAKFGLLRTIVAALTAGVLTKIPIILAIKAILVKLILVPLGFVILSLPIILPIALLFYPLWTRLKDAFIGTTAAPPVFVMMPMNMTNTTETKTKRSYDQVHNLFKTVLESDRCFERVACQLGARDADTPYVKPVSWLLKFLNTLKFVENNLEVRSLLKRYREAYMKGTDKKKARRKSGTESTDTVNSTMTVSEYIDDDENENNSADVCSSEEYPCNTSSLSSKPEIVRYSRYL